MPLRPALPRLIFLPVLLLLVAAPACGGYMGPGTIVLRVTKVVDGIGIEQCGRSVGPNEILKTITIRETDGTQVATVTMRGRDATVNERESDMPRCSLAAVKEVEVQTGNDYEITADDGETRDIDWPVEEMDDSCYVGDCKIYVKDVGVDFLARGQPEAAEILAMAKQGFDCPDVFKDPASAEIGSRFGTNLLCGILANMRIYDAELGSIAAAVSP
jgi:hypothetical protein